MINVFKTPAAETDLINIWVYIARDNYAAADRVYAAAEETFCMLAGMPEMGTVYSSENIDLQGLRFFPIKRYTNYMIYYRKMAIGIEIVRVLHSRMNKDNHL